MSEVLFSPEQWRHLFRETLREISYLPDPVARRYLREQYITRFRQNAFKLRIARKPPREDQDQDHDDDQKKKKKKRKPLVPYSSKPAVHLEAVLRRRANHFHHLIQRANEGYLNPLERVLLLAYGRIGPRRHALLRDLLRMEPEPQSPLLPTESKKNPPPQNTAEVKQILLAPRPFDDDWKPPTILIDLLRAQQKSKTVEDLRKGMRIKQLEPKVPEENAWGRPMPLVRRRNIRKKWFQNVTKSALPPLPEEDLKTLQGLIDGTVPWEPPVRRTRIQEQQPPSSSSPSYLDARFLACGPEKGPTFHRYASGRPHNITKRLMRRLWERIYTFVPLMDQHPTVPTRKTFTFTQKYVGGVVSVLNQDPAQAPEELFEGLDEVGRLVRPKKEEKSAAAAPPQQQDGDGDGSQDHAQNQGNDENHSRQ